MAAATTATEEAALLVVLDDVQQSLRLRGLGVLQADAYAITSGVARGRSRNVVNHVAKASQRGTCTHKLEFQDGYYSVALAMNAHQRGFDMVSQSFVVAMERATLHTDVLNVVAWIGTMGDAAVCSLLRGVGACRQGCSAPLH
jgi:hypothetical protein